MEQEEESRNTEEKMDEERTGVGKSEPDINKDEDETIIMIVIVIVSKL